MTYAASRCSKHGNRTPARALITVVSYSAKIQNSCYGRTLKVTPFKNYSSKLTIRKSTLIFSALLHVSVSHMSASSHKHSVKFHLVSKRTPCVASDVTVLDLQVEQLKQFTNF
jgi:hypothetical protein